MKVSILIIAHNEQAHIGSCIKSVLEQSHKADEVIIVVHNSTDKTKEIASQYRVTVIPFDGLEGIVSARVEGLKYVTGEIVLCIDGDSYAAQNWVEVMTATLQRGNVLVGSRVKFKGTIYGKIGSILNRYLFKGTGEKAAEWIWGPSFGFWQRDKERVRGYLERSIGLSHALRLSRNPDDYWLALFMGEKGAIEVTGKTWVLCNAKERNSLKALKRDIENVRNAAVMKTYFKKELVNKAYS